MTSQTLVLALASVLVLCCRGQVNRDKIMSATAKLRRLPVKECGEQSDKYIPTKIVGGEPAELGAYPWMAAIGYTRRNSRQVSWNCGASLITDQYVITAAHCLHRASIGQAKVSFVLLSDLNLDENVQDGASPLRIPVEQVIIHQAWSNKHSTNDIGLVKMDRKVQFWDLLKPICLPPPTFQDDTFVGKTAVITGWGLTSFSDRNSKSDVLREAEVDIQDLDVCRRNVTSQVKDAIIDNRVICASAPGKDSCQGDSGGPLLKFERLKKRTKMYLLGIVSYGHKCAEAGYPGVYTKVSEHMPWIIDNLDI